MCIAPPKFCQIALTVLAAIVLAVHGAQLGIGVEFFAAVEQLVLEPLKILAGFKDKRPLVVIFFSVYSLFIY